MTIHPMTTGRLDDLHPPTQQLSNSVNTETYGRSPPCKKLRLSLKGQRQLSLTKQTNKEFQQSNIDAISPNMQNMRPNLLDPMSLHASYVGSSLGVNSSLFGRSSDLALDNDGYEREKDKHQKNDSFPSDKQSPVPPVATLLNLGNTCFLNSVLYTLRFTPGFAHLLHHLANDLVEKKFLSSAGILDRKSGLPASGSPNSRIRLASSYLPVVSEDPSVHIDSSRKKAIVLTERLHELMQILHNAEQRGDLAEPFQADAFLQALREVNPLFQGNQQQDAHELLVCSLDYLREACKLVHTVSTANKESTAATAEVNASVNNIKQGKQNLPKKKKGKKIFDKDKESAKGKANVTSEANSQSPLSEGGQATSDADKAENTAAQPWDFISESFEGVTVLRTTCLECEYVTERKESFMDICLPIVNENTSGEEVNTNASALFASTLMEVDFLRDANKYWCEQCVRYNEARRSVHYEKLPRLLVLQLKRFSLSYGSTVHTSKVNDYMPTPMQLDCFCERCQASSDPPLHSYRLYAIIMHLGATMASGHYVAYTRVPQTLTEYETCSRNKASANSSNPARSSSDKPNTTSNPNSILRFFKPKSGNPSSAEVSNNTGNSTGLSVCKSLNCCSAYPRKLIEIQEKERDSVNRVNSGSLGATTPSDDLWLECDDEVIRILRVHELEELLSRKPRSPNVTPYLLFYVQESLASQSSAK